jgi:hypothetical protein
MGKTAKSFLLLCSITLCAATSLHAAWVQNGASIGAAAHSQRYPRAVSDDAGGAVFVWSDSRNTSPYNGIYAQRVDGYGNALWASNGAPVYANGFLSYYTPEIASDEAGGTIVVWSDNRNGGFDLFAQRIDAAGTVQWGAAGVTLSTAATVQRNYAIIADGAGGAIVAWQDSSSGSADIYAQKVNAGGAVQWTAGGVAICTNAFEQHEPCLITDGLGGAIIAWDDHRGGPSDIYAQLIGTGGAVAWTANGRVLCNAVNTQQEQCIVSDDAGGAIITWRDYRNSANWLLYAQRIDASGSVDWASNGVLVNTTVTNMYQVAIASDGWNGAIITWAQQGTVDQDIYAQRIGNLGYRQWNAGGNIVCASSATQSNPFIVSDGDRGAVIAWDDYRPGPTKDIYAQKLSYDGVRVWASNGVAACAEASDQAWQCIASDGAGGALIAWEDYRVGSSCDVYGQRIERNGYWGYPSPTITSVLDVPSDQGGHVTVTWKKSRLETIMAVVIDRYSVWRMIPSAQLEALLASGAKGADPAMLDGASVKPIYYISKASGAATGWELLAYVDATVSEAYSAQAATLFDSTAADPGLHHFMVMAHGTDHFAFWQSQPDSGWSVDNISPAQPASFSAEQSFDPIGLELSWGSGTFGALAESDFSHYALYRGMSSDFIPGPGNCLYEGPDTTYFDGDWRWNSGFYYKLSAVDVHGNESTYGLSGPDNVTGTETPKTPAATYLAQNAPNPFNPSTTIRFGLAAQARVTISIYDVSGRLVHTLVDGQRSPGLYKETWDGRDSNGRAVASGVYFYRLRAGAFSETKKMVLTR